jgi:hypothetical protein
LPGEAGIESDVSQIIHHKDRGLPKKASGIELFSWFRNPVLSQLPAIYTWSR